MSHRHAAFKATQAVVGAAKQGSSTSTTPSRASTIGNSDVKFARQFVQAALHGHSPLWHFRGWRSPGSAKSKNPKVNPHQYLSSRLIEGVLPENVPLPRKFRRQQAKFEPFKRYTRPFSTSAASRRYGFKEEPEEEDFEEEDPSEDGDGLPSLSVLSARRQLKPGDWVQMRLYVDNSYQVY